MGFTWATHYCGGHAVEISPGIDEAHIGCGIKEMIANKISNAKRLLLDIHHAVGDDYLQSYLDEYCYKFNRRYFDSVVIASPSCKWKNMCKLPDSQKRLFVLNA